MDTSLIGMQILAIDPCRCKYICGTPMAINIFGVALIFVVPPNDIAVL
jgi:hypothetical protein